jgi:hypothetical protein
MLSRQDYSDKTLDELRSAEEKLKSQKITTAVIVGFLVGVAIWAATHGKFFLTIVLFSVALRIGYVDGENRKHLRAEIDRRESAR